MDKKMRLSGSGTDSKAGIRWLKRLGFAGVAFFFVKGMLWLLVPWLAHTALF